jgi:D-tyrosyl-tRNA(Tyr) deacylase
VRAVVQRVTRASVRVGDETLARIDRGMVILFGAGSSDSAATARTLASKLAELRIFDDGAGKMNLSLRDVRGAALIVPQFTLYADVRRGRRPDFAAAAEPGEGRRLYEAFVGFMRDREIEVASGRFGAHMTVELENDGPVTVVLTTDGWPEGGLR